VLERLLALRECRDKNPSLSERLLNARQDRWIIVDGDRFRGSSEVEFEQEGSERRIKPIALNRFDQVSIRLPVKQDGFALFRNIPCHK